jgi:hypothetical protein
VSRSVYNFKLHGELAIVATSTRSGRRLHGKVSLVVVYVIMRERRYDL